MGSNRQSVTRISVRTKLSLILLLACCVANIPTGIAMFSYGRSQQRAIATRTLLSQGKLIAAATASALTSGDSDLAQRFVDHLLSNHDIRYAGIYDLRPTLVAGNGPPLAKPPGVYDDDGSLLLIEPIRSNGRQIGTVLLSSTAGQIDAQTRANIFRNILVSLFSLVLALFLSFRLQRCITRPITELTQLAQKVSRDKDYTVRAVRRGNDEVGFLVESFNQMLEQIERRARERKQALQSLRESEERYALAARGSNDGLWDWKIQTNEIYLSPRWQQMLGYEDGEIGPDPEDWLSRIHASDRERVRTAIAGHCRGETPEFVSEYRIRRKDGTFVWMLCRGIAIRDAEGNAIRMAGSQTDITADKVGDPLTGLPNRLFLMDKLESCFETARYGNQLFAVLYLDLDRFKMVNDSLGHAAGNSLLIEAAARLRATMSSFDQLREVNRSYTIARLGGDEFAVLLRDLRTPADPNPIAERILRQLSVPVQIHGRQLFLSASIGIALSSSAGTPEELLRNADTAMYHAKTNGKGRYSVFDEGMRERAAMRVEIESGLRRGIENQEFLLYYQAQISTLTGRVSGYEALVRWMHPDRGLLSPGEFIPIAEETGAIVSIGRWVLREAARQIVAWQNESNLDPRVTMSVNVSPRELREPDFVESVEAILRETGIHPSCLHLEVTENSIIGNNDLALETLCRLKALNLGLEIDDFGTGYSSLSYLQRLPFDTVKIDRSFVREIEHDNDSAEIVRSILDLTRSLGMTTIAEGVETPAQFNRLAELGCDQIQGYLFSKPLSPQQAIKLVDVVQTTASPLPVLWKSIQPA